jgi:hypothetical protein
MDEDHTFKILQGISYNEACKMYDKLFLLHMHKYKSIADTNIEIFHTMIKYGWSKERFLNYDRRR